MGVQVRLNNSNTPFILFGNGLADHDATLLQDAGRGTTALIYGTVMAKVAASQKWVPFTDETATNGTAIPLGIMVSGDVTGAALVAGDVIDQAILVGGGVTVDASQLTIENSKLLTTVVTIGTTMLVTVRDLLAMAGIFIEGTVAISASENA